MIKQHGVFLFLTLVLLGCNSSSNDQLVFKYANEQPEAALRSQSMLFFKDELEQRTQGRIIVNLFFGGVLGNERELMDLVATGALQGTRGGFFADANPKYQIFTMPFLVENWDQAICMVNSDFMHQINEGARVNGFHVPASGISQGFRAHTNNVKPIEQPSDLSGLKMRVPSQEVYIQTALAFGANPQEIPTIDVYQALQTGVVDGQDNAPSNIWDFKIYEVSKYLTISNYATGPDPFMVNLAWYEKLPVDLQATFDSVAVETMRRSDASNRSKELEYIESLSSHLEVNYIDASNLDDFKTAVQPVYDQFINKGIISEEDLDQIRTVTDGCS